MPDAIDPICLMKVDTENPSGGSFEHEDKTYYFCAPGCRIAFQKDPQTYLADDWKGIPMASPKPEPLLLRLFKKGR